MYIQLPLLNIPNQLFNITLNNQDCTVQLWAKNDRTYIDLYIQDVSIILGQICIIGGYILQYDWFPFVGDLFFISRSLDYPNYPDFGINTFLIYTDYNN